MRLWAGYGEALRRLRLEDCHEFKASWGYKTAWAVDETQPVNTVKRVGDGSVSKVLARLA